MKNIVCINARLLSVSYLSVYPSVCLSLSFPCAWKASSRAPKCYHEEANPQSCAPPPRPPPLARLTSRGKHPREQSLQPRGEAGTARPRASSLCVAANRNVNPKENRFYSQVSLGKAGVSQLPPNLPVLLPPLCEATTLSDSTC